MANLEEEKIVKDVIRFTLIVDSRGVVPSVDRINEIYEAFLFSSKIAADDV